MISIDKVLMSEITRQNRVALSRVRRWIADSDYENSLVHYGLPREIRAFIDRPMGMETTYSDLIAYFARRLTAPVRYLEIGVSVGKNFFQMLHQLRDADIVGLDIEDINPVLERNLEVRAFSEWETMLGSLRKKPSRLTEYVFPPNNNRVRYIAGDVFDANSWAKLKGETFNLIFSDAYHSPEAILSEWQMLKSLGLIDGREFAIVWDDLDTPEMQAAFGTIAGEMQSVYGVLPEDCGIGPARGWAGVHEPPHGVGIVIKRAT